MAERWRDRSVLVCRCEEVALGSILDAFDGGFRSAELLKRATRTMMGPCQGRMCRGTFARICASLLPPNLEAGRADDSIAALPGQDGRAVPGNRPPVRPITIGELAALERFAPPPPRETKELDEDLQ